MLKAADYSSIKYKSLQITIRNQLQWRFPTPIVCGFSYAQSLGVALALYLRVWAKYNTRNGK